MPLLFTALIFPVAFLLAAGTIGAMLATHGRRMVDALMLRPHDANAPLRRNPARHAPPARRAAGRAEALRPIPAFAYRPAA